MKFLSKEIKTLSERCFGDNIKIDIRDMKWFTWLKLQVDEKVTEARSYSRFEENIAKCEVNIYLLLEIVQMLPVS
jgi:hypothetical protein